MKIEIKHQYTGTVLYERECDDNAMAKTLRAALDANANLMNADLRNVDLRGADLRRADFRFVNLSGSDLSGSDLRRANLINANLIGATLRGADLDGVRVINADLFRADLHGSLIDGIAIPSAEEAAPLLKKVAQAALSAPDALDMFRWHTCETTHCIAGWAIALSGEKGREIEAKHGGATAGMLLLGVEAATHFYDKDHAARVWLRSILEA